LKDSVVISSPYSLKRLNDFEDPKLTENELSESESSPFPDIIVNTVDPGGGGGGVLTNTSFATAIELTPGASVALYLNSYYPNLYYKFNSSEISYYSIYSTGTFNTTGLLYDENFNVLEVNYVVSGHGLIYTSSPNFLINYYHDIDKTYYYRITPGTSGTSGFTSINLIQDNWYQGSYSSLIWIYDAVDSGYHMDYSETTQYDTELLASIEAWNELETVIIRKDTIWTVKDVIISDYTDINSTATANTNASNPDLLAVGLNNAYFPSMSATQRQKTIMHELGHCMGLYDFTATESLDNIMVQGIRSLTQFGPADLGVYRQKWG